MLDDGEKIGRGKLMDFKSSRNRGEVLEWSNRHAWRACVGFPDRGFESHPLRQ